MKRYVNGYEVDPSTAVKWPREERPAHIVLSRYQGLDTPVRMTPDEGRKLAAAIMAACDEAEGKPS